MSEPEAHLLVVDDDERIRGLLQAFLRRHGFIVTVARDAEHARREKLLKIVMPPKNSSWKPMKS